MGIFDSGPVRSKDTAASEFKYATCVEVNLNKALLHADSFWSALGALPVFPDKTAKAVMEGLEIWKQ